MALTQVKTLGIADDAVTLAKQAAGTDGQIITYDASGNPTAVGPGTDGQVLTSTGAGSPPAFEALPATGIASLVADTSPQLGGDLDTNSFEISLDDSHKVKFGDGADLEIEHTGSLGRIKNTDGELHICGDTIFLRGEGGSEDMIKCWKDGAVKLYYNDSDKLETIATGVNVTGGIRLGGNNAANELDDYEEGTWTPSLDGLSNTPSWHNVVGKYTKIGNVVKCQGFMQPNTLPTFTTASNVFKISGLPFALSGVGYTGVIGNVMWQQIEWAGASHSTYGQDDDTQITAAIASSTKTEFATCGQAKYYVGRLKNSVFGDGNSWTLEWDMTYYTSA